MGSLLCIIGNHKLSFTSGVDAIEQLKEILNIQINNGNLYSNEVNKKTTSLDEIKFFSSFDSLEQNFEKFGEVKLFTNYTYCTEITFFRRTLKYNNGCRYKYWKKCVFEEPYESNLKDQYEFCNLHWKKVRLFAIGLSKFLGGDKHIYFEDDRFQDEEFLCHQGKTIYELMKAMNEKWEPTDFKKLKEGNNTFQIKNGWFFEVLND